MLPSLRGVEWLESICKTTAPAPADSDDLLIHYRDEHPINENLQHLGTMGDPPSLSLVPLYQHLMHFLSEPCSSESLSFLHSTANEIFRLETRRLRSMEFCSQWIFTGHTGVNY